MEKHINRNRSFDKLSYTIHDKKARKVMVDYLTKNDYIDIVNKENYNFDIYAKYMLKDFSSMKLFSEHFLK